MTKKQQKDFEEWANKMLAKHIDTLGLGHRYSKVIFNDSTGYLETGCSYPYTYVTVFYSQSVVDYWLDGDHKKVERELLHEACHILTDPFYTKAHSRYVSEDEIRHERELLTDKISEIVWKHTEKK